MLANNSLTLDQNVKIDDLHLRRSLLAGYCKLLVFGALPVRAALPVFKNCVQVFEVELDRDLNNKQT